jgi:hypothetical protein
LVSVIHRILASTFICFHTPAIWSLFIAGLLSDGSAARNAFVPEKRSAPLRGSGPRRADRQSAASRNAASDQAVEIFLQAHIFPLQVSGGFNKSRLTKRSAGVAQG